MKAGKRTQPPHFSHVQSTPADYSNACAAQVPHGAACDGFHVAAHAYRQLADQLLAANCSRLTAVMLGTEHRGTTPIALSRRVGIAIVY
jgi:hypothetical protein